MAKVVKLFTYVFALIGLLVTVGGGYVYATNPELVNEFWSVKDEFRTVPAERKKEVIAELPARVKFENAVASEMAVLPEERQKELYEQLAKSRDSVFENFKKRITAEAEITKKTKDKVEAAKEIIKQLGKVDVSVDMGGSKKSETPKADPLASVVTAQDKVADASGAYGDAQDTGDKKKKVAAALNVLRALDKLGEEVQKARKLSLSGDDKTRLTRVVNDAKSRLYDVKQTPGLSEDPAAKPLFESIPKKLNS